MERLISLKHRDSTFKVRNVRERVIGRDYLKNKNYEYHYHEVQKKITIGQQNINYRISTFLGTFVHVMIQQMEPQLQFSDHSFCSSKPDIRYEPYLSSSDF